MSWLSLYRCRVAVRLAAVVVQGLVDSLAWAEEGAGQERPTREPAWGAAPTWAVWGDPADPELRW